MPVVDAKQPILLAQAAPIANPNFIANVVERVGPAVVRINSSRTVRTSGFPSQFFPGQPREFEQQGEGSGFIVTDDGLIFTNSHVVEGTRHVEVVLKDGRTFDGEVLGSDPLTDVAVVRITTDAQLPTVEMGDSSRLTPGEWAIAIGNPLGLDNTVTVGIISAIGRSAADVGIPMQRAEFIQTDAAINPGNSGGPLLNERGQVVAINTAIIRGANGIGFAVPIQTAQRIANQLIATGKVSRAYIGIQMSTLTPELRDRINEDPQAPFQVTTSEGVLVQAVSRDGPAARSGLRAGDVIVAINDRNIRDAGNLQQLVEGVAVGDTLSVRVMRNNRQQTFRVKTAEFPAELISRQ
jgi:S1-C subfamily serine protease